MKHVIWTSEITDIDACLPNELYDMFPAGDKIVVIGKLVRWNGGKNAYKKLDANTVGDAIEEMGNIFHYGSVTVYAEDDRVYLSQTGHDNPVNPSIFEARAYKEEDEDELEDLLYEYIRNNTNTADELIVATAPVGTNLDTIYGW